MDLCFFVLPCSAPKVVGLRLVGWSARATGALLDFLGLSFPSVLARQRTMIDLRVPSLPSPTAPGASRVVAQAPLSPPSLP